MTLWIERAREAEQVAVEVEAAAYDAATAWAYDIDEASSGEQIIGSLTLDFLRRCLPRDLAEVIANELRVPYAVGRLTSSHS